MSFRAFTSRIASAYVPYSVHVYEPFGLPRRFWISYDRQRLHVQRAGAEARVPVVGRATATVP